MKQQGKKWAGEERGQGNNSEGTDSRKDKCKKYTSTLFLEKNLYLTITSIGEYLEMVVKIAEFSLTDCPFLNFSLQRARKLRTEMFFLEN